MKTPEMKKLLKAVREDPMLVAMATQDAIELSQMFQPQAVEYRRDLRLLNRLANAAWDGAWVSVQSVQED